MAHAPVLAFFLLLAARTVAAAGCGGDDPADPVRVVQDWSKPSMPAKVVHGKITLWHQLPSDAAGSQTA